MNKIVFDLEATCKKDDHRFQNEIIEIGAVKLDNDNKLVGEFDVFVKPIINPTLTDFCKSLTTINQEDVDSADKFKLSILKFIEWIGDQPYILCSWGFYDKKQIEKDCKLNGLLNHKEIQSFMRNKHISLKHQHGDILGTKPMGMERALKLANLKLDGTHHRGIDDARNIAKIFCAYQDKWKY